MPMPRERAFWWILSTLLVAAALGGLLRCGPRRVELRLSRAAGTPEEQPVSRRRFEEGAFEPLFRLESGPGASLVRPTALAPAPGGDLLVLDSGAGAVVRLSPTGARVASYELGDGANPTDMAVAGDGRVWVAEPRRRRIVVFEAGGRLAHIVELDRIVLRLVPEPAGGFVGLSPDGRGRTFAHFTPDGQAVGGFGRFLDGEAASLLGLDGWLVRDGEGGFVYLLRHAGLLAAFGPDGRRLWLVRTIDPVPWPVVAFDGHGGQRLERKTPPASVSGSLEEGTLFVLALAAEPGGLRPVLDLYERTTGRYLSSTHLPDASRDAVVAGPNLYAVTRDGVAGWRREGGPSQAFRAETSTLVR